jgi:hypothetical protein
MGRLVHDNAFNRFAYSGYSDKIQYNNIDDLSNFNPGNFNILGCTFRGYINTATLDIFDGYNITPKSYFTVEPVGQGYDAIVTWWDVDGETETPVQRTQYFYSAI